MAIRGELDAMDREPDVVQLKLEGLATEDERRQLSRDLEALRRRVEEIPGEIERETQRITDRYASRDVRRFPVALTFLVPPALAGQS